MSQKPTAARAKSAKPKPALSTPEETAVVAPQGYDNHSFILQAIMENQKALGRLEKTLEAMQSDIKGIQDSIHSHSRAIWLSTGVLLCISVLGGFFVNAVWDRAVAVMSIDIPGIEQAIELSKNPHIPDFEKP